MKLFTSFKLFAALVILTSVVIFSSCHKNVVAPAEEQSIQGVLTDGIGQTVPNAILEAIQVEKSKTTILSEKIIATDTTDEDGNFSFKNLQADLSNVELKISQSDIKPYRENFSKLVTGQDKKNVKLCVY